MVVITISKCPASLRGDLSKWFFEVSQGVYVGTVSQRVRENVWDRIEKVLSLVERFSFILVTMNKS